MFFRHRLGHGCGRNFWSFRDNTGLHFGPDFENSLYFSISLFHGFPRHLESSTSYPDGGHESPLRPPGHTVSPFIILSAGPCFPRASRPQVWILLQLSVMFFDNINHLMLSCQNQNPGPFAPAPAPLEIRYTTQNPLIFKLVCRVAKFPKALKKQQNSTPKSIKRDFC